MHWTIVIEHNRLIGPGQSVTSTYGLMHHIGVADCHIQLHTHTYMYRPSGREGPAKVPVKCIRKIYTYGGIHLSKQFAGKGNHNYIHVAGWVHKYWSDFMSIYIHCHHVKSKSKQGRECRKCSNDLGSLLNPQTAQVTSLEPVMKCHPDASRTIQVMWWRVKKNAKQIIMFTVKD